MNYAARRITKIVWAGQKGQPLEDFANLILRSAEAHSIRSLHDRALDENRMLNHGVQDLIVGDVRAVEAELFGQRLLRTEPVAGAHSSPIVKPPELIASGGILQIFVDPHVATGITQDVQGFSRRAAHRIVKNC